MTLPDADVAGIYSVLTKLLRALFVFGEKNMTVVMKIADDRRRDALIRKPIDDFRHGCRRFFGIDGYSD